MIPVPYGIEPDWDPRRAFAADGLGSVHPLGATPVSGLADLDTFRRIRLFRFSIEPREARMVELLRFFLRGEIDIANVDDVELRLYRTSVAHRGDVIVDCMDLEFIGVCGFTMLTKMASAFADGGRALRLAHPTQTLATMIDIFGAGDLVVEPSHPVASNGQRAHSDSRV